MALELLVVGTDTGVGKTYVTTLIVDALRGLGRRVRVHKPVAAGAGDGETADDADLLADLADPEQPAGSACPLSFPEAAAPSVCARRHDIPLTAAVMADRIAALRWDGDLVVEGIGGVLSPVGSDDSTILDVTAAMNLPVLLVTRPHLGTLNHTRLAVEAIQQRKRRVAGLVLNHHEVLRPSLATEGVGAYLARLTGVPLLAEIPFADGGAGVARTLVETVDVA